MSSANTFGQVFRLTTFGESHGVGLGAVIEGCPSGIPFDLDLIEKELMRRRPGQHGLSSQRPQSDRNEEDQVELISGVYEGVTLGTPIAMLVRNKDQRSKDYSNIKSSPRPGHADDLWQGKYTHYDHRGGGRSSGRETVGRVLGGAVAGMLLQELSPKTQVTGFITQIGPIQLSDREIKDIKNNTVNSQFVDQYKTRIPNKEKDKEASDLLEVAKEEGKSYGALVEVQIHQPPKFLGQPVFHKLKSDLTAAMLSVGATVGVEFGGGFSLAKEEGSYLHGEKGKDHPEIYGGIRGGISTGEDIHLRIAIKPTSTVLDVAKKGRHDPCVALRAIPVFEAMARLVLADHLLQKRFDNL